MISLLKGLHCFLHETSDSGSRSCIKIYYHTYCKNMYIHVSIYTNIYIHNINAYIIACLHTFTWKYTFIVHLSLNSGHHLEKNCGFSQVSVLTSLNSKKGLPKALAWKCSKDPTPGRKVCPTHKGSFFTGQTPTKKKARDTVDGSEIRQSPVDVW